MTESYDLRSNIKGKPGSQGTLFQVKDKSLLNPMQRWPRGYAPERQAEVSDALKDTALIGGGVVRRSTPEEYENTGEYATYPKGAAEIKDTLSRSSIPVEHMRDLRDIGGHVGSRAASGVYYPGQGRIDLDWKRESRDQRETTLVHEMGHHAAYVTGEGQARTLSHAAKAAKSTEDEFDENAGEYKGVSYHYSQMDKGVNEAIADNYLEQHYRPHPATVRRGMKDITAIPGSTYDRRFNQGVIERDYPGYTEERPRQSSLGPQFHQHELMSSLSVERDQERARGEF